MFQATLKSLLSRKLRLILSGFAVVLGVTFVSGAFVLTDTLGRSFENMFATAYENTDVAVTAKPKVATGGYEGDAEAPGLVPATLVDRVRSVPGVASAQGNAEADGARVIGSDGKVVTTIGPPRMGSGWNADDKMIILRTGRGPEADDEIAVNALLARSADIKVGDKVGVLTTQPKRTFTLVGVFGYSGGRDTIGGMQQVAFTEPIAQELMLGERGVYSSITVTTKPGVPETTVRDRIRAQLGADYQVRTGDELRKEAASSFKKGLAFFNYILLGFAGVALFVGIFLILNTFSIIVAQRTKELALLRAVGGSRIQMIVSVLIEAVIIGLLASVLGLGAGIGIGALLASIFGNMGDMALELAGIGVPLIAIISSFVVGLGVTVVAALMPALRASRIPPIAALQEAATPDRPLTKISVLGSIVTAVGGATLGLGLAGTGSGTTTLWLILGGVLICFIGVALLTPIVARPVVSVIGRLFSWSVPGKLGRLNSGRNPRRTAITAAALMVGLALITGVNVILDSTKASIMKIADESVSADLIISGEGANGMPAAFDPAVLDQASGLAGVKSVTGEYFDTGLVNGEKDWFNAVTDLPAYSRVFSLRAKEGELRPLAPNEGVVDEKTAKERGVRVGDTVRVQTVKGDERAMTITGIYAKSELLSGWVFAKELAAGFRVQQLSWGYLTLDEGASIGAVRDQVAKLLADSPEVSVADRSDFIDQQMAEADSLLVMIQILLALAILIAVLGVINTLALSVLERTRELGLLRAIGLGRWQTTRMITVEAVVISVFGALLGVAVGCGLGAAVVRALHDEGIKELAFPWMDMAIYLGLAALVGVIAAILPAIRASRVNVLNAIAYE
jgi:putative ABC transport system permease protein